MEDKQEGGETKGKDHKFDDLCSISKLNDSSKSCTVTMGSSASSLCREDWMVIQYPKESTKDNGSFSESSFVRIDECRSMIPTVSSRRSSIASPVIQKRHPEVIELVTASCGSKEPCDLQENSHNKSDDSSSSLLVDETISYLKITDSNQLSQGSFPSPSESISRSGAFFSGTKNLAQEITLFGDDDEDISILGVQDSEDQGAAISAASIQSTSNRSRGQSKNRCRDDSKMQSSTRRRRVAIGGPNARRPLQPVSHSLKSLPREIELMDDELAGCEEDLYAKMANDADAASSIFVTNKKIVDGYGNGGI